MTQQVDPQPPGESLSAGSTPKEHLAIGGTNSGPPPPHTLSVKPDELTVGRLLKEMKLSHLCAVTGVLVSVVVAAFQGGVWFAKWESGGSGPSSSTRANPRYREDGLIADFTTEADGRRLNTLGEVFNIVSDAELGGTSITQWSRMAERNNNFLRISFDLKPNNDIEGYGGVWTDLSFPPPKEHDVSDFNKLAMRMRLSKSARFPRVFVALASGNLTRDDAHPGHYDWPEHELPRSELNSKWVNVEAELAAFKPPEWSKRKGLIRLDSKRIFRLIVAIKANNNREAMNGYLDIDDVRFVK